MDSLRTNHSKETIERFSATLPGKRETISHFHRLDPNGISPTLLAGTNKERGGKRVITNREAARLHSFPDWFRFHPTKLTGFREIGNSVTPALAKAVASEITKALDITPIKPTIVWELGKLPDYS